MVESARPRAVGSERRVWFLVKDPWQDHCMTHLVVSQGFSLVVVLSFS